MSTRLVLTVVLGALSATACNPFSRGQAVRVSTDDPTMNTAWHGTLVSPVSLAGAVQMTGTALMAPDVDSTRTTVNVSLANAAPGGLHPWEVREGRCGSALDRGVFGSRDKYSPLKVDREGHATGNATVPVTISGRANYAVVVYASDANSMIVACGNMAPPAR